MPDKIKPLGICDLCEGPIPANRWYTKSGPRLYCSIDCRNAANSRNSADIRRQKTLARMAAGEWINPIILHPADPKVQGEKSRAARLREVAEGRWRNPALDQTAREKLSRPRKHTGDLASAIEKLKKGISVSELTPEEQEAHRAWRRELQRKKKHGTS